MRQIETCLLCAGKDFLTYSQGIYGKDISICKNCQLVFTNPQPEPQELLPRYGADYYAAWVSPRQQSRREKLWAKRVALLKRVRPQGKLLDVGCGEGLFLHCAQRAGYEVSGVEISEFAVSYARKKYGLHIQQGSLEDACLPENAFDLITLWHTLEHLPAPDLTLRQAYQLLKRGGYLFAAVPNVANSVEQKFYRLLRGHYFPLYTAEAKEPHLWHFSGATLKLLLEKCNFKAVALGADFAQVDPRWRVVEYLAALFSKLFRQQAYSAILAVARK